MEVIKSNHQKLVNEHIYLAISQFQVRSSVCIQRVIDSKYTLMKAFPPMECLPHSMKRTEMQRERTEITQTNKNMTFAFYSLENPTN